MPETLPALADLCGQNNDHLQQLERSLNVEIANNSYSFQVAGEEHQALTTEHIIQQLYQDALNNRAINAEAIHLYIQQTKMDDANTDAQHQHLVITTPRMKVHPRGSNQKNFVSGIQNNTVQFGIGPAGTGKTWLAVASALQDLLTKKIARLILTRPAVEAGEKLGFLPGDLSQKVDPYLRPLFDALYDMAGAEMVDRLISRNLIEIAPLAFMRGRSLNNAFIILDESQNTTIEQMKMLLTRIGFGSRAVITGDLSQIDLAKNITSGLGHAQRVLTQVPDVGFTGFGVKDVVRHPVVQNIVQAYDAFQEGSTSHQHKKGVYHDKNTH